MTNEMRINMGLPAFTCDKMKVDGTFTLRMLSDYINKGIVLIPKGGVLDDEMPKIIWKRDEETGAIMPELDEKLGEHPD
jgi:hypothetical protein